MRRLLILHFIFSISIILFSFVSAYSEEEINAYEYAFDKGITTAVDINKANLNSEITRIEMAKMMSNYAINILGLKPDTNRKCFFYDVDPNIDAQYDNGITKICQLGLMGILDDGSISDYFNPFNTVTRGQWATIFSRALNKFREEFVIEGDPFYKPHLANLYKKGLVQNVKVPSPISNEKRGNVLIMMYRTDPSNVVTVNYTTGKTKLKAGQIYRNAYYGFEILSTRQHARIVNIGEEGDISLCNFVEKKYDNLIIDPIYEDDFGKIAHELGEKGLINCMHGVYGVVKKGGPKDIDLEKEGGYLDSPYDKIDLNNGYIILEYPKLWGQEPQYQYTGEKYEKLKEIESLGVRFSWVDKDIYKYGEDLYDNILEIEWTLSMNIYDDFKLQPIQNNDKLYQILSNERNVDVSEQLGFLDSEYEKLISIKNRLNKRKKEYVMENPDFNINDNLIEFKENAKKIVNENFSSSPLEKLTAIKFFKDEFGIYLADVRI